MSSDISQPASPPPGSRGNRSAGRRGVRSVGAQVADAIQEMILAGDLSPGEAITQEQVAESLGVSTMPVREALLQLSHDGLVTTARRRSFQVAPTTRADVRDIYWMHATLAGEISARTCASERRLEVVAALREVHARWMQTADSGGSDVLEELNFEFHRIINVAADAPKLRVFMRSTLRLIPMRFYSLLPEWKTASTVGHQAIIDALESGDEGLTREVASNHVLEAGETFIHYFDDKGYWTLPSGS